MSNALLSLICSVIFAGALAAQTANKPDIASQDAEKTDAHDRPIGGITMRLPGPTGSSSGSATQPPPVVNPVPPSENEEIPPSETGPEVPAEDAPTFYGEPVTGNVGILLDVSGSIVATKIAALRAETSAFIDTLEETQHLDIAVFNANIQGYVAFMWGVFLPATEGNKNGAKNFVNGPSLNPAGKTPLYEALQKTLEVFPADMNVFFMCTDAACLKQAMILSELPVWWTKFEEAKFIGVYLPVGCPLFMQAMLATVDGIYVAG